MLAFHEMTIQERDRVMMGLHRLKMNGDFKQFISLLEMSLTQSDLVLRQADGHQLFRQQGTSQSLEAILAAIRDSSGYVQSRKAELD